MMNRVVVWTALLATTVGITGCPIFPDETGCTADRDCADSYVCDLGTNRCVSTTQSGSACYSPAGCGINDTCGSDGYCHTGDCSFWGCVNGDVCAVSGGVWTCEPLLGTGGSSTGGANGTGGISFGGSSFGGMTAGGGFGGWVLAGGAGGSGAGGHPGGAGGASAAAGSSSSVAGAGG
jgi:hypothetical protein